MNFILRFHDQKVFGMALTVIELSGLVCETDSVALTITADEANVDSVVETLRHDGVNESDVNDEGFESESFETDQFRTDGEADGDALASAGFGTDEDYGCFGDRDE